MEMGAHGQPRSTYKKDGRVAMAYYAWNHRASYEHMSACIIVRGGKSLLVPLIAIVANTQKK